MDRNLGNEDVAVSGFQEAIKLLESLILKPEEAGLEPRVRFSGCFSLLVVWILKINMISCYNAAPFSAGIPK